MSEHINVVFNGLPVWSKVMLFLSSVAFSSVVALFFLGQSAGYIPTTLATKEQVAELQQNNRTMLHVMYQVCMNTAQSSVERERCWPDTRAVLSP